MQSAILQQLNRSRRDRQPVVLYTWLDGSRQGLYATGTDEDELTTDQLALARKALVTNDCQMDDKGLVFFQPFNPPLRMFIIGAVHISQSLANMAQLCGYQVTVIDPRQSFATADRFPGIDVVTDWPDKALQSRQPDNRSAIITLTHDPKLDDPALQAALVSPAFYIGALGSQKTQRARRTRLEKMGFSDTDQARIHGPVGLDIGARSPAEIAVAIMGQVTETLYKDAD